MRKTVLLLAFVLCSSVAQADIIPELQAVTGLGPNNFLWTYQVDLTDNSRLEEGGEDQFFTIYDFNGYIAGSIQAAPGWSGSTQLTGRDPSGLGAPGAPYPADDPTTVNLVFTWDGGAPVTGPQDLGIFSARSTLSLEKLASYQGQSTNNTGGMADGTLMGNRGQVETPTGQEDVIPEPGTMALLGSALLGLGVLRHRRS